MITKEKKMREVSPLLQKIINWSSIIGALATLAFCIWAYFAGILQSKETLSAFILQAGIFGPLSLSFFKSSRQWCLLSLVLWRLSLGSLSMATSLGPSTTTSASSLAVPSSSTSRECTGLSLSSLWSARRLTTSILTGSTKANGLIVSSSSWWSGLSVQRTFSAC